MKGGIELTQENQSYLRFSLEESVWFQKGQEVDELYSISLAPNVTLTEDDHYVYIRGTLDLSGEYKNDDENEAAEDYMNIFLPKSVQNVERHSNGMYEFVHQFPVDITIPSSRIATLDDIEVSIHTFDYATPERNSIKLQADLIISGIYGENYEEPSENEAEQDWNEDSFTVINERVINDQNAEFEDEAVEVAISGVLSQLDNLVEKAEDLADELEQVDKRLEVAEASVEEKKDAVDQQIYSSMNDSPVKNIAAVPPIPDFQPAFRKSQENEGELYEPFIVESKRTPEKEELTDPVFLGKKQVMPQFDIPVQKYQAEEQIQPIEREAQPLSAKEEEPVNAENKEKITKEREEVSLIHLVQKSRRPSAPVENREQKQEAKQAEQAEAKGKTSEPLSISDFFGRKQEEEHVRVKVCIVQKGETLDDLAERYSISVQTLLQSNELQPNQDIYEGQVLYIRQAHTYKN